MKRSRHLFNKTKFINNKNLEYTLPIVANYIYPGAQLPEPNNLIGLSFPSNILPDSTAKVHTYNDFPIEKRHELMLKKLKEISLTSKKFCNEKDEIASIVLNYLKDIDITNLTEREISKLLTFKRKQIEADIELYLGSPDPLSNISNVPCYGCGAYLHCKDDSLSGYIASNVFKSKSYNDLYEALCQRCNLLINQNYALSVVVGKDKYNQIIESIRNKPGIIILLVDIFDIANSINPDLLKLVGEDKQLYIIGNKVDLVPKDTSNWLRRIKVIIKKAVIDSLNITNLNTITGISLISAKTGFGVESLVTNLQNLYDKKGDVYLIGSTNSGKSTLFNTLLHSDYSRGHANEIFSKASTSEWPGTTLNLLKFPVSKPTPWKLAARNRRLEYVAKRKGLLEAGIYKEQSNFALTKRNPYYDALISDVFAISKTTIPLSKLVDQEFRSLTPSDMAKIMSQGSKAIVAGTAGGRDQSRDKTSTRTSTLALPQKKPGREGDRTEEGGSRGVELAHKMFQLRQSNNELLSELRNRDSPAFKYHFTKGKWLYDTPGTVHDDQILSLLTMEELYDVLPKETVNPRTCQLKPQRTVFISGLARIDCLEGPEQIFLTIFASEKLPMVVMDTSDAEQYYAQNLGKASLKVPRGNLERLASFPPLMHKDFDVEGCDKWKCSADLFLSSIGWASYTSDNGTRSKLRVHTPAGKGLGIRNYPLVPFAVVRRGGMSKVPDVYNTIPFDKWIT